MSFKSSKQRPPDWILKVAPRGDYKAAQRIGAGWNNPKGHINIQIDLGSFVTHNPELVVLLFPNDRKEKQPCPRIGGCLGETCCCHTGDCD